MRLTTKRLLFLTLVVMSLSIVLVGGMVRGSGTRITFPRLHNGTHSPQQLAWICGAPPVACA